MYTTGELPRPRVAIPLLIIDEATQSGGWLEGRTKLTKLVFLAEREADTAYRRLTSPDDPYSFVPYNYGPFSSDLLADLEILARHNLLEIGLRNLDSRGRAVEYLYRVIPEGHRLAQSIRDDEAAQALRELARALRKQETATGIVTS